MTLKVGMIGLGGSAGLHVAGWRESQDAKLAAGADASAERLGRWGAEQAIGKVYVDPLEMIAEADVDIVDICAPDRNRANLAITTLEAGKHVISEGLLAATPEEVRRVISSRSQADKMLMTVHSRRFEGASLAMKSELETGALGDVYHARGWCLIRAGDRKEGGVLLDIGANLLDQILWFMENPRPISVSGIVRTNGGDQAIASAYDDVFGAALVRFETGATLVLEVSNRLDVPDSTQIWLYGTKGGCHWPSCTFYETNEKTLHHHDRQLKLTPKLTGQARACIEFARVHCFRR